ncbi:MAG: TetR/AcrR family transcriptional regulator [Ornithinimicrobium sp.]
MAVTVYGRSAQGEGHLLRERILQAAVARMSDGQSVEEISVRHIAADVGKTVPALYQHFASKTDLLVAAATQALDDMAIDVGLELSDETDLDTRLRRRAHAYVDFAVAHPVPYELLFMTPTSRPRGRDSLQIMMSSVGFNALLEDLDAAQTAGQMVPSDIQSVALILWTALHGVASLLIAHPDLDWPPDLLDDVLDQHALGIAPR